MDEKARCQRCNAPLTGQAVFGLCANCLLNMALDAPEKDPLENENGAAQPSRILGEYELLEVIGRGGMGIVYRARQKDLNRMVALKMVHNWRDASSDTRARFRVEAEAAAKLDHPHIVPTYQIGEMDGQPFFSMKLVAGTSLGTKLNQLGLKPTPGDRKTPSRNMRESQRGIAELLGKVARAVHFAHQHGVIHRDLKPNNILIDSDGEPHLTDFGLAKLLEQDSGLTRTNDVLGTPSYMAPEQASGKIISPAVDIYSLGAILYELLTGAPPFRGKSPLETLRKAADEEPVPPTTINRGADAELAAVCLKCLEKNPMQRYESALALAEDLGRWIRQEPVEARRAGPLARTVRWGKRNPVGASLIGTLCAGLIGALVLLSMVNAEKDKNAAVSKDLEQADREKTQSYALLVALLREQLEGLWLRSDRRMLHISSEQLAALSGLTVVPVANKSTIERFSFGLVANESPVNDSQKYALLLAHLEQKLTERRGHPVRIDLKLYKFKEDRVEALLTNGITLARMGDIYFLKTRERHPGFEALVQGETRLKMAVFFTRTNTGIRTLPDLKGRSLAFGDAVSGITFWGQVKLLDAGITGKDLKEYVCIDSRSEFIEDVHELGYDAAMKRRLWLHSTADVIEDVIGGRYDAGVTSQRGFEKHKHRGLVQISGSEFERTISPWVGAKNLPADIAADFIAVMTAIKGEAFLLVVPGRPSSFIPVTKDSFNEANAALKRIEGLFPLLPTTNDTGEPDL
jgi:serine/threonine protein kinase/ABC-type phosphate/phosphonate transport system substrate-binding protein